MKDKILVELVVPDIGETYDLYIPVQRKVGNVISLLCKAISELTNGVYLISNKVALYNANTGEAYAMDVTIYDTDIRNGARLILF